MVPIENQKTKTILGLLILFLLAIGFVAFAMKDYLKLYLFYSSTKNIPFLVSYQSPLFENLQPLKEKEQVFSQNRGFQVLVRKDNSGNLFALWDDNLFNVFSLAIFEVPEDGSLFDPQNPPIVYSITINQITPPGSPPVNDIYLKSPFRLGDTKKGYAVFPKDKPFQLQEGKKYTLQALKTFTDEKGNPQVSEARYNFIYK